jgi:hypothetical protein
MDMNMKQIYGTVVGAVIVPYFEPFNGMPRTDSLL